MCRTFIGDAEHIYDVNLTDDQLILGIKGTLSVMELSVLKSRLFQGQEHKAQRGELYTLVAPGYICADGTSLVKDPNVRVQEAIALVLRKFRALGVCGRVFTWFHRGGHCASGEQVRPWPDAAGVATADVSCDQIYAQKSSVCRGLCA